MSRDIGSVTSTRLMMVQYSSIFVVSIDAVCQTLDSIHLWLELNTMPSLLWLSTDSMEIPSHLMTGQWITWHSWTLNKHLLISLTSLVITMWKTRLYLLLVVVIQEPCQLGSGRDIHTWQSVLGHHLVLYSQSLTSGNLMSRHINQLLRVEKNAQLLSRQVWHT